MKKLCNRIISGAFALVTLFFACMPRVYALPSVDVEVDVVDLFQWVSGELGNTRDAIWGFLWSKIDDDVCRSAPSVGGRHNFVEKRTQVNGKLGLYYICEYCGKSAGEVGQEAYNDYVSDLPASIYSSTGGLCWKIVPYVGYNPVSSLVSSTRYADYLRVYYNGTSTRDTLQFTLILNEDFLAPVDGTYSMEIVTLMQENCTGIDTYPGYHNFGKLVLAGNIVVYQGKNTGNGSAFKNISRSAFYSGSSGYWYGYLLISCVPHTPPSGGTYTTNTRPTGITGGNYGIVGDNGQITTVVDNSTIVNETNNTYYNPATGQKETITNWTYDYSDRSYHLTLQSGDTVTVTYGDQNITIIQGGDTYNIYYIIDGGCVDPDPDPEPTETPGPSDPDPTDPPHFEHSWKQTGRTEPTCTAPGQIQYTCERCGQTQVELIPPNGHIWQQKQFVPTTYDDEGNLIEQGYTIYECSVCGEQYRDDKGTGPPSNIGSGSDIDDGGLLGFLNSLTKYLSDNLSGVVDLIVSFFRTIPELFSGFTAFLAAMFPFFPDEVMMLLTFGIAALVIIGVIKAIRR